MEFFNLPVTNAYNNLTAVSIRIGTPGSKGVKSVLVNAHFDSVFGTTGRAHKASDLYPVCCYRNHKDMLGFMRLGGPGTGRHFSQKCNMLCAFWQETS